MSLMATIMWLTEKGLTVKVSQRSPEDRIEITISAKNGNSMTTRFDPDEFNQAFDMDGYAARHLKLMGDDFKKIFKEEF